MEYFGCLEKGHFVDNPKVLGIPSVAQVKDSCLNEQGLVGLARCPRDLAVFNVVTF